MRAAALGSIALLRQYLTDAGVETGYSTFNWALTDGHTVIVTRYCDKAPRVPPPSLYYTFCDNQSLRSQLSACNGWCVSRMLRSTCDSGSTGSGCLYCR